jgi:hypothetical protein
MVPNQRQLYVVVSDWGSYLGSHSPIVLCGILSTDSCLCAQQIAACFVCAFVVLFGVHIIKRKMYAYHAAPWSIPYDDRDREPLQIRIRVDRRKCVR